VTPGLWKTVTRFDRARIHPWMALRNALGVALPLAAGALMGHPGGGLVAATGALNVAFSDGADSYTDRARRMLSATLSCALAVFMGALTGRLHALAAAEAALCAFLAGMMVAVSPAAADIGNVTLITLVVYSAQVMSPGQAAIAGLLSLGGGLLQIALSLALWPVRRYLPERRALADVYAELARIDAVAPAGDAPPATAQMAAAQAAMEALGGHRSLEAERYIALFSQAERIRLALLTLSGLRAPELQRVLALASEVLKAVAHSLESGRPAAVSSASTAEFRALVEQMRRRDSDPIVHDTRWQVESLAGRLRSALDLTGHLTPEGVREFQRREAAQPWRLRLAGTLALLRANLRIGSAVFRHAVRLSVCVVAGMLAGHLIDWRRSYWMPMTIVIVLRPDFATTVSRGLLRLGGTLAGLVLATALFHLLAPGVAVKILMIGLFAFLIRCYGPANYGVLVTALTALVVLLLTILGGAPGEVMVARGLNTAAGGAIALLAYWLWPTWERAQISEALAALLDAYRAYFRAVSSAYLEPERSFAAQLDHVRIAARLARSNLEAAATRLRSEPGSPHSRIHAVDSILANSHRFIYAAMSLEAGLGRGRPVPARNAFRVLADHADLTLYYLAASLRGSRIAAADLPDLREDHHALASSGDPTVERYALANLETDRMANSLNTISEEVLRWQ